MQNEDIGQQPGKPVRPRKKNNVVAGVLLLVAGSVLMMRQVEPSLIPGWLFTWPMILIIVGFFVGLQTNFRDIGWLILMGIGTFFLSDYIFPYRDTSRFAIPIVVFCVGLVLIFSPGRRKKRRRDQDMADYAATTTSGEPAPPAQNVLRDDVIEVVSIFGNVKKVIYTKSFRGGEIVSIFGGAEINLSQADFKGPIVVEIVQVFGGTKLVVPPDWVIRSEAVAIFGGIEDKRPSQPVPSSDKVLILQGTALFAGIEIRSF